METEKEKTKKPRITKRLLIAIIAAVLVVVMVVITSTSAFANNRYLYISDIRMAYAATQEKAEQQLTDAGYTPVHQNLRASLGSSDYGESGYWACLGYKTTDNKAEAITDVKFMNMNSGYKTMNYSALMESYETSISKNAKKLLAAIQEMKKNVEKKYTLALAGKSVLDMFYYEDADGNHIPLSDYLFDDARTEKDLRPMTIACNTSVLNTIYNALTLGCAETLSTNFSGNFADQTLPDLSETYDWSQDDSENYENAKSVAESIITFAENYEIGAADCTKTVTAANGDVVAEDVSVSEDVETSKKTTTEITYSGEISDEYVDAAKEMNKDGDNSAAYEAVTAESSGEVTEDESNYLVYVSVYQALAEIDLPKGLDGSDYGNPQNLAEYLVGFGNAIKDKDTLSKADYRYLYPFVSSFTDNQVYVLKISGITALATWLTDKAETTSVRNDLYNEIQSEVMPDLKEIAGKSNAVDENDKIDVYLGVRDEIFNEEVGVTANSYLTDAAEREYGKLTETKVDAYALKLEKALKIINIVSTCIQFVSLIATIAVSVAVGSAAGLGTMFSVLVVGGSWLATGFSTCTMVFAAIGVVAGCLAILATVAVIVVLILFFIHSKQKDPFYDEATYTSIPKRVFDYQDAVRDSDDNLISDSYFAEYDAVLTADGAKIADMNGYKSVDSISQWDVLYYTKDSAVSSPIVVEKNNADSLFTFSASDYQATDTNRVVSRFGQVVATNTRLYYNYRHEAQDKGVSYEPLFMFFRTENSVDGKTDGPQYEEGKYLEKITIATESTSDAAIDDLVRQGYTVVGYNLSPYSDKFSYLGYTTTSSKTEAIKDIRVDNGIYSKSGRKFGSLSYACVGITGNYTGFFTTQMSEAGFPILAESLRISSDSSKAYAGEEPVNLFCGGDFYDLSLSTGKKYGSDGVYMFFSYEEENRFTSSSEQYVDGISFVYTDLSGTDCRNYIESKGFDQVIIYTSGGYYRSYNYELTSGMSDVGGRTYLAISKTANPYRAITDIHTYEAPRLSDYSQLMASMNVGGYGYAACETFHKIGSSDYTRSTHAYVSYTEGENALHENNNDGTGPLHTEDEIEIMDDFENSTVFSDNGAPFKGLYVQGPTTALNSTTKEYETNALKLSDIKFNTSSETPEGYKPVTNFLDMYSNQAENLTFEYFSSDLSKESNHVYIFIKGEATTRGKYVQSVYVGSYYKSKDKDSGDSSASFANESAIESILSECGECKIIRYNLTDDQDTQIIGSYKNKINYDSDNVTDQTAFVAVTYTDNVNKAITDIKVQSFSTYSEAEDTYTIKVGGTTYSKCGGVIKYVGDSDDSVSSSSSVYNSIKEKEAKDARDITYAFYTTDNASFGDPLTDVFIDSSPYQDGHTAIFTTDNNFNYLTAFYPGYTRADTGDVNYYVNKIAVSWDDDKNDAKKDLLKQGCTNIIDWDKNKALGGDYVYFGYSMTTDGSDENILTGIKCYSITNNISDGNNRTIDGLDYKCISTHDLNDDCRGRFTYLFASTDTKANPISKVFLASAKNYTPTETENYYLTTGDFAEGTSGNYVLGYVPTKCWSLSKDSTTKDHLTIKYYGNMPSFTDDYPAPWNKYASYIKTVEIAENVTSVTANSLTGIADDDKQLKIIFDRKGTEKINIEDGAIPKGSIIVAYADSDAYNYYMAHGEEDNLTFRFIGVEKTYTDENDDTTSISLYNDTLTIEGSGILGDEDPDIDYNKAETTPWGDAIYTLTEDATLMNNNLSQIQNVVIKGDFTEIKDDYFKTLSNLTSVTIYSENVEFGDIFNSNCVGNIAFSSYMNSPTYDYCISNGYNFASYIVSQTNDNDQVKETWDLSGDTLIIKAKKGTFKNTETDNTHNNSKYGIDKTAIKHVLVLNTVAALPDNSFDGYTNLLDFKVVNDVISQNTTATTPAGAKATYKLKIIPPYCFRNCENLETVALPSTITTVSDYAYSGCSKISEMELSSTVKSVGSHAFDCGTDENPLTLTVNNDSCEIPLDAVSDSKVTIICNKNSYAYACAMSNKCNVQSLNASTDAALKWTLDTDGKLTINYSGKISKSTWGNLIFFVRSVEFTNDVTTLPSAAFKNFTELKTITFPAGLTAVPASCCDGCTSLETMEFTASSDGTYSITSIGNAAFKGCEKLNLVGENTHKAEVSCCLPEGITTIGQNAFKGICNPTDNEQGIQLPSTLTSIGSNAITWPHGFVLFTATDCEVEEDSVSAECVHLYPDASEDVVTALSTNNKIEYVADWSFSDGTLTFEGSDNTDEEIAIETYADSVSAPWEIYTDSITTIDIGCDKVPAAAFGTYSVDLITTATEKYSDLETVIFSNSNGVAIGDDAFNHTPVQKIEFSNDGYIESIGERAFYCCANLCGIDGSIFNKTKSIGAYAFFNCYSMFTDTVIIPNGVESIGTAAFESTNLMKIILPQSLKTLGAKAIYTTFRHELMYAEVVVYSKDCKYGNQAICVNDIYGSADSTLFTEYKVTVDSNKSKFRQDMNFQVIPTFSISDGILTISGTGSMYTYGSAEETAWFNDSSITTVRVNEGITAITSYAFSSLPNLTDVYTPNTLTTIRANAFADDGKLAAISVPSNKVTFESPLFGDSNFSGTVQCYKGSTTEKNLKAASINVGAMTDIQYKYSDGTLNIIYCDSDSIAKWSSDNSFSITDVKKVTFDESITEVGAGMLSGFTNLTDCELPDAVTTIPDSFFYGDTSLKQIDFPASLTAIGNNAFCNCTAFNLCQTDEYGYVYCSLPEGLKTIGSNAFANVKDIVNDNRNSADGGNTYDCRLFLPTTLESIGDNAFDNDTVSIWLPSDNCTIGNIKCLELYYSYKNEENFNAFMDAYPEAIAEDYDAIAGWEIENGTLTFSADEISLVPDYNSPVQMPWYQYRDEITNVVVGSNVYCLGELSCSYMSSLETADFGEDLQYVDEFIFTNSPKLTKVTVHSELVNCGYYMVDDLDSVQFVVAKSNETSYDLLWDHMYNVIQDSSLVSSAFSDAPQVWIVAAFAVALLGFMVYLVIRRYRKKNSGKV